MKFFFPDSQDLVDPGYDFQTESYAEFRVRQRDDHYAHEVLKPTPFQGILVSKAIVDGVGSDKSGKYSVAQRHRLRRAGVRAFFRAGHDMLFMGDCGAYSYKDEDVPPYTVEEVVEFYAECQFDLGISVDHLVLQYDRSGADYLPGLEPSYDRARQRQALTLELAAEFMRLQRMDGSFTPVGVAQGWNPSSYAAAVKSLQGMEYDYIALGSMVPLRTSDILACLEAVDAVRRPQTRVHLLGVTRLDNIAEFARFGVASFDSTSPLLQAFKDGKNNYYTLTGAFTAIRIPQVEGNAKLGAAIRSGQVDGQQARRLEQDALMAMRAYDADRLSLDGVMDALQSYSMFVGERQDRSDAYTALLQERPWRSCECAICKAIGIDVVMFRGSERNKRRGFSQSSCIWPALTEPSAAARKRRPIPSTV
jgi:hypothetical protein